MAPTGDAVYATLLMNDAYLPGAMVLGHSLRDRGAKSRLVVLVLVDAVSANTISDLQTIYDEIVPVQKIMNKAPANLYLMNRPDLIGTFTKIQLWKQTQYKRIVYIDADVVALRAPNELLTMDTDFAAVPDIGWPDCFNSGMMVLNPNLADYYALLALAERGISFDGADQGLLNMHFTEWERLSFKYNCTPSGNYQYVPAYRHFQSTINLIHFIGRDKPWNLGRENRYNVGVYGELLARWWAVYDRHYRSKETVYYKEGQYTHSPRKVQDYVAGEQTVYLSEPQAPPTIAIEPPPEGATSEQPMGDQPSVEEQIRNEDYQPTSTVEQRRFSAPHSDWEPTRAPPPTNSKPEAANFPSQVYDFSEDRKLFRPPANYPDAPKDMWFEVPEKVAPQPKLKSVFPWEERAPKPTRVFLQPDIPSPPIMLASPRGSIASASLPTESTSAASRSPHGSTQLQSQSGNFQSSIAPPATTSTAPFLAAVATPFSVSTTRPGPTFHPKHGDANRSTPFTYAADRYAAPVQEQQEAPVNPWESLRERSNVWDDMPEIAQYVQALQPPRRGPIQVLHHTPDTTMGVPSDLLSPTGQPGRRPSLRVTDFPTELERPSLPVTPAPIRRPTFWGEENDMSGELPTAEGVPDQVEWNPFARLDDLQRRQGETLLGHDSVNLLKEPPRRDLPESASREAVEAAVEKATSPTSTRPLKPILKEPKFELEDIPADRVVNNTRSTIHDAVTDDPDLLSPGDAGERTGTSNLRSQVAA